MTKTKNGWTVHDQDAGVLSYTYQFAPGATANAFAARLGDGRMMVVSPPCRIEDGVFEDLSEFGELGAIVANNGFHHLGLSEWKTKFPEARCFADPRAAARIAKKNKDAPELEPLDDVLKNLANGVKITALPNTKCGELWARADTKDGFVWFASDTLSNLPSLPDNFFLRTFFKVTGTKAGYGVFHTALNFTVKDKKGALRRMAQELSEDQPCTVVPGHGPILTEAGLPERTQQVIAAAL